MRGEEEEREKKQSITVAVTYPTYPNRKETKRQVGKSHRLEKTAGVAFEFLTSPVAHTRIPF